MQWTAERLLSEVLAELSHEVGVSPQRRFQQNQTLFVVGRPFAHTGSSLLTFNTACRDGGLFIVNCSRDRDIPNREQDGDSCPREWL